MKRKIVVTRRLPESVMRPLEDMFIVDAWPEENQPIPRETLLEKIKGADGLLCMLTEKVDRELLGAAPDLKAISTMSVGYDHIDIASAKEKKILVANTPGVLTETTADLTFALLLATARRVVESARFLQDGKWETWSPLQLTGMDVYGATIGIVGLGRIGEAVARRAKGFGMKVIYSSRTRKEELEKELGLEYRSFDTLLQEADFVSLLLPYSPDVHHLIGEEELGRMKKTAILINTARGGLVDENALHDALDKGEIWAAGMDVFEKEPVDSDHPLLTLPNFVALPHIGSASVTTRIKMAKMAADNLIAALTGREVANLAEK